VDPTPATFTGDVTALARSGTNRLSFLVGNANIGTNPTGLQFHATLTYEVSAVPAPGGLTLTAVGIVCLTGIGIRRRFGGKMPAP
jgi:hypothetical protein